MKKVFIVLLVAGSVVEVMEVEELLAKYLFPNGIPVWHDLHTL